MKKRKEEVEEVEEVEEESEEAVKKEKRKEGVEKRKNAKKKDKIARWGGLILFGLILFVGFLLWVFGEMSQDPTSSLAPQGHVQNVNVPVGNESGSVIVR